MSLIKKAHNLLTQSRLESSPRKAYMLRKASAETYNEIIVFSFIYGVVTGNSDYASAVSGMDKGTSFVESVAIIIKETHNLPERSLRNGKQFDIGYRLANEFFNATKLGSLNFYNTMLKGFAYSLKSADRAEDAIHNVLSGRNPVTDSEYTRAEERNQFAYAGKNNSTLRNAFLNALASLREDPSSPIEKMFNLTKASILTTIGLLKERLKSYSGGRHGLPVDFMEDIQQQRNQQSGIERSVEDYLPSGGDKETELFFSALSESAVNELIILFQKGYGWKNKNSQSDRRAIAFYLFSMKVFFEENELKNIVSFEDEKEILQQIALYPTQIMGSGVAEIGRQLYKNQKDLLKMNSERDSDFMEELQNIYEEVNPKDLFAQSSGDRSFQTTWTDFLKEIGEDLIALKEGLPLPNNPSAKPDLESASHIFRYATQKRKASLKARVASLLRRYNQI